MGRVNCKLTHKGSSAADETEEAALWRKCAAFTVDQNIRTEVRCPGFLYTDAHSNAKGPEG